MSYDPISRAFTGALLAGALLTGALLAGGLAAQAPVTETLIRDLNLQPGTQRYGSGARVQEATASRLWFSAFSPFEGRALWTTDGTPRNTRLHSDVSPGPGTGEVRGGVTLPNGRFLTMAQSSIFGLEPFVSDPSQPGLQILVDLVPGTAGSDASAPVLWRGEAWFLATTPGAGTELWRTDGTPAGTRMSNELIGGPGSHEFSDVGLRVVGSDLYFVTTDATPALWVKRQPANAPRQLVLLPEFGRSTRPYLGEIGGRLVFPGTSVDGTEPWITDGTPVNTRQLVDLEPGPRSSDAWILAGDAQRLWFAGNTDATGWELYLTDGTTAGTRMVADASPGMFDSIVGSSTGAILPNGDLLYSAAGSQTGFLGAELWRSDGLTVWLEADLFPGLNSSEPQHFQNLGGQVWFSAETAAHGRELWRYDDATRSAVRMTDLEPGQLDSDPVPMASVGGRLIFTASSPGTGHEPWAIDAATGTVTLLADIYPDETADSLPLGYLRHRDFLLFTANANEVWTTDGTDAGTRFLRALGSGGRLARPETLGSLGEVALFGAATGPSGALELWRTDGTPTGTAVIPVSLQVPVGARFRQGVTLADSIVFTTEAFTETRLWRSDGTAAGTREITGPLPTTSGLTPVTVGGDGRAYGIEEASIVGRRPFVTDGSAAGTRTLANTSIPFEFAGHLTAVPDGVVFAASTPGLGAQLWFAGSNPPTLMQLTTRATFGTNAMVRSACRLGGGALFFVQDLATGSSVFWSTDGTVAGTTPIAANLPPLVLRTTTLLTSAGEAAYFWARSSTTSGLELWITDGTPNGFRHVFTPVTAIFDPVGLYPIGDGTHVVTALQEPASGRELWISDGTTAGTRQLTDSATGAADANPFPPVRIADRLVFTGKSRRSGYEPHAVHLEHTGAHVASTFGKGCGATVTTSGRPTLGTAFSLDATFSASRSPTGLLFGTEPAWSDLALGCTLHLQRPLALAVTSTDATGTARIGFTIPNVPALVGDLLHFQCFAAVPGGPFAGTVAGTPGVEVVVGR